MWRDTILVSSFFDIRLDTFRFHWRTSSQYRRKRETAAAGFASILRRCVIRSPQGWRLSRPLTSGQRAASSGASASAAGPERSGPRRGRSAFAALACDGPPRALRSRRGFPAERADRPRLPAELLRETRRTFMRGIYHAGLGRGSREPVVHALAARVRHRAIPIGLRAYAVAA